MGFLSRARSIRARNIERSIVAWLVITATLVVAAPAANSGVGDPPITGSFFVDFDRDGRIDTGEQIADGDALYPPNAISVTAYDALGSTSVGVVTPGTPPTFSVDVTGLTGSDYRLEFGLDPADMTAGWTETFLGPDSRTSIQFVSAGDVATFGVVPPSRCPTTGVGFDGNANSSDGKLWSTCFVNGVRTSGGPQDVLVGLNYDRTNSVEPIGMKNGGNSADNTTNTDSDELGSLWGVAYDEWTSTLYTSASLRRHAGLGHEGVDGLYWISYPSGEWQSASLGASYGTEPARDLAGSGAQSHDSDAFNLVASTGIGDIDLSADGRTLMAMNLETKSVDVFDVSAIATAGPVPAGSHAISNPCPDAGAFPNDYQPYALTADHNGSVYVGVVCTAETSQNQNTIAAHVLTMNIATGATGAVIDFGLDYLRACTYAELPTFGCEGPRDGRFRPWLSYPEVAGQPALEAASGLENYPTPVLADIELDTDGSLILGFVDRTAMQMWTGQWYPDPANESTTEGSISGGELLRVCNTSGDPFAPTFVLEGAPGCDPSVNFPDTTGGDIRQASLHSGPLTNAEWYGAESFIWSPGTADEGGHPETSDGGLYVHPAYDELVVTSMDPNTVNAGGFQWYDNTSGAENAAFDLFVGSGAYAAKGVGIGDVEGCFISIEIGDFVWLDSNGDGVQDPGETPLQGVTITVTGPGLPGSGVTVTTDSNGQWTVGSTEGLTHGVTYTITVDPSTNVTALPGGFTNADLAETTVDALSTNDLGDSDISGGTMTVITGAPGANNHSYDAGYTLPFDLAVRKTVDLTSTSFPLAPGDDVVFLIELINQGQSVEQVKLVDYVNLAVWEPFSTTANPDGTTGGDASLPYTWDPATSGAPTVEIVGTLLPGQTVSIPVTLSIPADYSVSTGSLLNTVEIAEFDDDGDPNTPAPTDVDSTPDTTNNDPVSDDIVNEGPTTGDTSGDGIVDEDDHDPAVIPLLDVALRKTLDPATVLPVSTTDTVTFHIEVFNQGATDATDLVITDYVNLTMWEAFDVAINPAGTTTGDQTLPYTWATAGTSGVVTITGTIAPGESMLVPVTLTVAAAADVTALSNMAEISGVTATTDHDNNSATPPVVVLNPDGSSVTDIDSVPDNNNNEYNSADPGNDALIDNVINNSGGDEDDHDIALVQPATYSVGNQVWADTNNNGILDTGETFFAGVVVQLFTDTNGDGMADDLNGDGSIDSSDAVATTTTDSNGGYLFTGLASGDYVVGLAPSNWDQGGALHGWLSSDPTETNPNTDVDNDDNGTPGQGGYVWSGTVTLNDPEPLSEPGLANDPNTLDQYSNLTVDFGFWHPVFDLALRKRIASGVDVENLAVGDLITFDIEVFNQGNISARDITVVDYLPAALELADSDWQLHSNGSATTQYSGTIEPGQSATVQITVKLVASGQTSNQAEIVLANPVDNAGNQILMPNGEPLPDVDSHPDATNSDPLTDEIIDNSNGDEDDHDTAGISVRGTQTTLAFSGLNSGRVATYALLLIALGSALTVLAVRRRRTLLDALSTVSPRPTQ